MTRTKFDPKVEHERRLASAMSRCVFFTGVQHEVCEVGVRYDSLKTSPPTCLPCLPNQASPTVAVGVCEKVRMTTREEAEAEIASSDAAYQRIRTCLVSIKEKHGKAKGLRDSMPCPVGCGGTLHYSISGYNGHVHGQCSTEGCAQWMQ